MNVAQNMQDPGTHERLDAIRVNVRRTGCAVVQSEQFSLLCPNHMTVPEQFQRIAELAADAGCSFAFLPDGTVRFETNAPPTDGFSS